MLDERGRLSCIHRQKPKGGPMFKATAHTNVKKLSVRAAVDRVFVHQKSRYVLFIRIVDLERAEAKLVLADLATIY